LQSDWDATKADLEATKNDLSGKELFLHSIYLMKLKIFKNVRRYQIGFRANENRFSEYFP
jgi:hypothetical protein